MPRTQFERRTNALLVSDALNNLDINTYVNDRNDICIDGYKIGFRFSVPEKRTLAYRLFLDVARLRIGFQARASPSVPSWNDAHRR